MMPSPAGLLGHHASAITKLYHYVNMKMTWADAQSYCREHFDDLATVDNPEELRQVKASRDGFTYQKDRMWIGLYDDLTKWQWSYGNQEYKRDQHYGNWLPGVPNFTGAKENCTKMTMTGQWDDSACNLLYSAVCINGGLDLFCYIRQFDVVLCIIPLFSHANASITFFCLRLRHTLRSEHILTFSSVSSSMFN